MRRSLKAALGAGIVGGVAYAAWRAWRTRLPERATLDWSTAPFPFPPAPRPAGSELRGAPTPTRTDPNHDGSCPVSFPIKAKLTSGIYHAPGGLNYDRTKADRCYADGRAAEADGLRASKV